LPVLVNISGDACDARVFKRRHQIRPDSLNSSFLTASSSRGIPPRLRRLSRSPIHLRDRSGDSCDGGLSCGRISFMFSLHDHIYSSGFARTMSA